MAPDGSSNIRVFVRWHDQTVFAGEEVKCRITFKNVAASPNTPRVPQGYQRQQPNTDRPRQAHQRKKSNTAGLAPPPAARGHRSTLSLNVPTQTSHGRSRAGSIPFSPPQLDTGRGRHSHRRSISIVSIGSAASTAASVADDQSQASSSSARPSGRPRGHTRSASLQIVPRSGPAVNGIRAGEELVLGGPNAFRINRSIASHPNRQFHGPTSPLSNTSFPPERSTSRRGPSGASTLPNTPLIGGIGGPSRRAPDKIPEFKFPAAPASPSGSKEEAPNPYEEIASPNSDAPDYSNYPLRPKDPPVPIINENGAIPATRILSTTSIGGGTPRSSGEFYSVSNHSSETLASEYVTQQPHRNHDRPSPYRRQSNFGSLTPKQAPETLMIGYAQIQGSFTLDGSLINTGPFEEVKRKAVVGGQGGGVVGLETAKRDSGLLRGFGWGSFTSSIGELLGGGELSSIKDMRGIAGSKSIPLLSTPQSILFVDLQLTPGESRSFDFSFKLPRGLPPSHKGRAIKISYSLVIGTQRPGGTKEQEVKSVEIPFRILGSVNNHGDILGHDLRQPYVILQDQANITKIQKTPSPMQHSKTGSTSDSTMTGFLSYVDELLASQQGNSGAILSPTATLSRRPSAFDDMKSAKQAIEEAIQRSNRAGRNQQAPNRFDIARDGKLVGVVMLARKAYRLGEMVTMAIDFSQAEKPCYAVHAALETAEKINASLALRSESSVYRYTRKVHAAASEATLFSRRIMFTPTIPVNATPEFVTSSVEFEWSIKLEFVTPVSTEDDHEVVRYAHQGDYEEDPETPSSAGGHLEDRDGPHPLLEEISNEAKGGLILAAVENVVCESFEVSVPIRVYGAVCEGLERLERDAASEEGLVV